MGIDTNLSYYQRLHVSSLRYFLVTTSASSTLLFLPKTLNHVAETVETASASWSGEPSAQGDNWHKNDSALPV